MTQVPDEELLSAYLDGELSGEDLLRAEQMLADRPDARQLLDEMQVLRAGLQALPRLKLERGFAEGVLRQAERQMLQPAEGHSAPARSDAAGSPTVLSWPRWRRPLVWSALAVAASLLIMFFAPPERERGRVAVAPPPRVDGEMQASRDGAPAAATDALAANAATQEAAVAGKPASAAAPRAEFAARFSQPNLQDGGFDLVPVDQYLARQNMARRSEDSRAAGAEDVLIVYCDAPVAADAEAALREALLQQHVDWDDSPPRLWEGAASRPSSSAGDSTLAQSTAADQGVLVVATPAQIDSALANLAQARHVFRQVVVEQPAAQETAASSVAADAPSGDGKDRAAAKLTWQQEPKQRAQTQATGGTLEQAGRKIGAGLRADAPAALAKEPAAASRAARVWLPYTPPEARAPRALDEESDRQNKTPAREKPLADAKIADDQRAGANVKDAAERSRGAAGQRTVLFVIRKLPAEDTQPAEPPQP